MESSQAGGLTTRYFYNGIGQRVAKVGNTSATYFIYDTEGRLLGEYDASGSPIQETIYLGDLPVAVVKPGSAKPASSQIAPPELFSIYADQIMTPRAITRLSDNRMVWRWDSTDPFGMQPPDERPDGLAVYTFGARFPGQYFDKETNSHYNYWGPVGQVKFLHLWPGQIPPGGTAPIVG